MLASILVAADKTPDGRHAIRTAAALASASEARLTVLEVVRVGSEGTVPMGRVATNRNQLGRTDELASFERWVGTLDSGLPAERSEVAVAYGVPGIEIGRLADQRQADLIVLGRRPRSSDHPLILGETADALVRRSPRPVLFVPPAVQTIRSVLIALDGTERTISLVRPAATLAEATGAALSAITVQQPGAETGPARLEGLLARALPDVAQPPLTIRIGNPIVEVLNHVETTQPDLLVIGYRRGGPPKVIGPADIARNLLYSAPSAVLTIPL